MLKPVKLFLVLGLTTTLLFLGSFATAQDTDENGGDAGDLFKDLLKDALDDAVSGGLNPPEITWPASGREFPEYLGPLPLQWQQPEGALKYDIEVDCKICKDIQGWGGNRDQIWQYIRRVEDTKYNLDLSSVTADGPWKWRVRSRNDKRKSKWSKWSYFTFQYEEQIEEVVEEVNVYDQNIEDQDDASTVSDEEFADDSDESLYDDEEPEQESDDSGYAGVDDSTEVEGQDYSEDDASDDSNDQGYSDDDYGDDEYGQSSDGSGTIEEGYNQD